MLRAQEEFAPPILFSLLIFSGIIIISFSRPFIDYLLTAACSGRFCFGLERFQI